MTKVHVVQGACLSPRQLQAWDQIQQTVPGLESPYFRPEFTQQVAAVRDDVEVGILEEGNDICGFFPYQRGAWRVGYPVGGRLSDFQAVIALPHAVWDARELVQACGLRSWRFHHLLAAQQPFAPYQESTAVSPVMDLSEGFEAYCRRAQSSVIPQVQRKTRKLEREVGPLRFDFQSGEREALLTIRQWKSQQYRESEIVDPFTFDWITQLVEQIFERREPQFSGVLSTLHAGDRLVAAHFGMRSGSVLHWWFPAYDREFARYSPGSILLLEIARAAESQGIRRIDLGKGEETYKTWFSTGAIALASGIVGESPLVRALRHGWRRVRDSRWMSPARFAAACTRSLREQRTFR